MQRSATIALFMILSLPAAAAANVAETRPNASATLGFGNAEPRQAKLTDPRTGKTYKVELEVDPGVNGRATVVDLVLLRTGSDGDLLLPLGLFHGLQPYDFAALDLIGGPDKSAFGRVRTIPIRRTATKLIVRIDDVAIRPPHPARDSDSAEVTRLTVHVALGTSPKSDS